MSEFLFLPCVNNICSSTLYDVSSIYWVVYFMFSQRKSCFESYNWSLCWLSKCRNIILFVSKCPNWTYIINFRKKEEEEAMIKEKEEKNFKFQKKKKLKWKFKGQNLFFVPENLNSENLFTSTLLLAFSFLKIK